jgi:hypothetical protein
MNLPVIWEVQSRHYKPLERCKMSLLCHFVFSWFIWLLPDGHCRERLLPEERPGPRPELVSDYESDPGY